MIAAAILLACADPIPDAAELVGECAYVTVGDPEWDVWIEPSKADLGLGDVAGAWAGMFVVDVTDGGVGCEPDGPTIQAEVAYADDLDEWEPVGAALLCSGPEDHGEPITQNVYYVPSEQDVSACRAWAWE